MNILVCVKRVPATGGRIVLTADGRTIDTRYLGFTVSPHEECAVEEAVRLVEAHGGALGGPDPRARRGGGAAAGRDGIGIERAILLETDGGDWDPVATAGAIVDAIRAQEAADGPFDLILFGNEAADTGDFQVGIRVALALGRPSSQRRQGADGRRGRRPPAARRRRRLGDVRAAAAGRRRGQGGDQPAALSIGAGPPAGAQEGDRAVDAGASRRRARKIGLRLPPGRGTAAIVLGRGADAAPAVVDMLARIGVLDA